MNSSRRKAKEAQNREMQTIQPKEALSTLTKATLTIENYLGGKYYFTTDEIKIESNKVFLIEAKHSKTSILPSIGDIKDGLLKMILYTNLKDISISGKSYKAIPVIKLTSTKLAKGITINDKTDIDEFSNLYKLNRKQKDTIKKLFEEAKENNFDVIIEKAE